MEAGLKNELAFANRQAQNNEVSVKGSGGSFHYFSWGGGHTQLWLSVGLNTLRVSVPHTQKLRLQE